MQGAMSNNRPTIIGHHGSRTLRTPRTQQTPGTIMQWKNHLSNPASIATISATTNAEDDDNKGDITKELGFMDQAFFEWANEKEEQAKNRLLCGIQELLEELKRIPPKARSTFNDMVVECRLALQLTAKKADLVYDHDRMLCEWRKRMNYITAQARSEPNADSNQVAQALVYGRQKARMNKAKSKAAKTEAKAKEEEHSAALSDVHQHHIVLGDNSATHRTIGTSVARFVNMAEKYSESINADYEFKKEQVHKKVLAELKQFFPWSSEEEVGRVYDARKNKKCFYDADDSKKALCKRIYGKIEASTDHPVPSMISAYRQCLAKECDIEESAPARQHFQNLLNYFEYGYKKFKLPSTMVSGFREMLNDEWTELTNQE